jgi:hypothetical protein
MKRKMYTLVLKIDNSVRGTDERFDFEPLSWWIDNGDGTSNVHQRVYKDGGVLFGESDKFHESLSDAVGDWDRFVSLTPIR